MNVALWLSRAAKQRPLQNAIVFGSTTTTYAELAERSLRLGAALRHLGLVSGDRVALLQKNGPHFVEAMFGAWSAGLIVVPINSRAHVREAAHVIESSGAAVVITGPEYEEELRAALAPSAAPLLISLSPNSSALRYGELIERHMALPAPKERRPDDLAWLFYTSGTTGHPKGAMLSHRNLRQMAVLHLADVRSFEPGEVVLHAAPLTHGSGLVLLACIARGAQNVLYPGSSFDAGSVLDLVAAERVASVAFLAPTQILALNDAMHARPRNLSLESVCYGGAPMFTNDLRKALELFGPVFVQIYGQGEAPMTIAALSPSDHVRFEQSGDKRLGSVGLPRTDVEIAIAGPGERAARPGERGEVLVRGDVVMQGYWQDEKATAETLGSGWLRTGDIGLIDESGYLFLLDRSKDLIISGGANIYPREVEEAILSMPQVAQVAVIGLPDAYWGESVHALVVAQNGETLTAEEVIRHCQTLLASYKKPRTVEFVERLPVNAYGKIMKRALRAAAARHTTQAIKRQSVEPAP